MKNGKGDHLPIFSQSKIVIFLVSEDFKVVKTIYDPGNLTAVAVYICISQSLYDLSEFQAIRYPQDGGQIIIMQATEDKWELARQQAIVFFPS